MTDDRRLARLGFLVLGYAQGGPPRPPKPRHFAGPAPFVRVRTE
jgi:hypothetical protein